MAQDTSVPAMLDRESSGKHWKRIWAIPVGDSLCNTYSLNSTDIKGTNECIGLTGSSAPIRKHWSKPYHILADILLSLRVLTHHSGKGC
jgi:hypothetical protein